MKKKTEINRDQIKVKVNTLNCSFEGCSRTFLSSSRLKVHLQGHLGIKCFECNYCGKKFSEKGNLKVHKRIHTGERPFKCTFSGCTADYKVYSHLKDHINSRHLNQRNYSCEMCLKSFYRNDALRNHQRIHTQNPTEFECGRCKKIFPSKEERLSHHRTKHAKNIKENIESECGNKGLTDLNAIIFINNLEQFPETDDRSLNIWNVDMQFKYEENERDGSKCNRGDLGENECRNFLLWSEG